MGGHKDKNISLNTICLDLRIFFLGSRQLMSDNTKQKVDIRFEFYS